MQDRKNKKKKPAEILQPFYLIWFLYIYRLMTSILPQSAPVITRSPRTSRHESKKKSPVSTHKKLKTIEHAPQPEQDNSPEQGNSTEAESPPLLKFSSARENSTAKRKATEDKPAKKSTATVSVADHSILKVYNEPLWKIFKICISETRMQLIKRLPQSLLDKPVNQFIENLAFLYRYHLVTISMHGLTRRGDNDNSEMERMRVILVHNAVYHLFEKIDETRAAFAELDLEELKLINRDHTKFDESAIAASLRELPLYLSMKDVKEKYLPSITKKELENWVVNGAIPLLNIVYHIYKQSNHEEQRAACDHALKMLVIMIGEYGPDCGRLDEDKFEVSDSGKYEDFLRNCSELRNFYAHKVPTLKTKRLEEQLFRLMEAASKLNPTMPPVANPQFEKRLSPHSVRAHYDKEVRQRKTTSPTAK